MKPEKPREFLFNILRRSLSLAFVFIHKSLYRPMNFLIVSNFLKTRARGRELGENQMRHQCFSIVLISFAIVKAQMLS